MFAFRTAVDEGRLRELIARGKKAGISEEIMIRVNVRLVVKCCNRNVTLYAADDTALQPAPKRR
jgi:hypothetical protein